MAGARVHSPLLQCEGKAKFKSQSRAEKSAKRLREKTCEVIVAYRCPHCGFVHLGNEEPSVKEKLYREKKRRLMEVA